MSAAYWTVGLRLVAQVRQVHRDTGAEAAPRGGQSLPVGTGTSEVEPWLCLLQATVCDSDTSLRLSPGSEGTTHRPFLRPQVRRPRRT